MIEYNYEMSQADQKIEKLAHVRIDYIKVIYEFCGFDLGETENTINYRNYMVDDQLMLAAGFNFEENYGGFIEGFDGISANIISFMLSNEGWYDDRAPKGYGDILSGDGSAVAGQSFIDKGGVITVGPGLTNALNNNSWMTKKIEPGVLFTLPEIATIYVNTLKTHLNQIKRINSNILSLSQNTIDACIDLAHSGVKWIQPLAHASTAAEVAEICSHGPVTSLGQRLTGLVQRRIAEAAIALGIRTVDDKGAQQKLDQYYNISPRASKLLSAISSLK